MTASDTPRTDECEFTAVIYDSVMRSEEVKVVHSSRMREVERELSEARAETADHVRWLDEMVADYRLSADPHNSSKRVAIDMLIYDLRADLKTQLALWKKRMDKADEDQSKWMHACRKAEAERDAAVKDAERYQFLKKHPGWRTYKWLSEGGPPIPRPLNDAEIDAEIVKDAAIAEGKP